MSTGDEQAALDFYRELARCLRAGQLTPEAAVQQAGGGSPAHPISVDGVRQWLADAHAAAPHSPRESWALAYAAHVAVESWADPLLAPSAKRIEGLAAECDLALGVALNALGRFAEVVPLLQEVPERFLKHGRPDLASRCYSETALACTYLGQFEVAQAALTRARESLAGPSTGLRTSLDDPRAHCDRAEGLFYLEQNRYAEAAALLRRAGNAFATAGCQAEAALAWCYLAETLRFSDPQEALNWLDKARCVPALGDSHVHSARCDYILAVIYEELNRYTESLTLCRQAQAALAREGLACLMALCDLYQGIVHYRLNQYDEALQAYSRARANFVAETLSSHIARCDLNVAIIFYAVNRYTEALALYQQVAEKALAEGQVLRAARCHTNMGLCYDRLGRYDRAVVLHDRAHQAFLEAGSPIYAALCQENLAGTCRRLGRHAEALKHYRQAREAFAQQDMHLYMARCDTHMADLYLALGGYPAPSPRPSPALPTRPKPPGEGRGEGRGGGLGAEEALICLEQARAVCHQEGMMVHVAACDREMACVRAQLGRENEALALLTQAKAIFAEKGLLVDATLCDLAAGEVYLGRGEAAVAAPLFTAALAVLDPGFPDEAWRARYGLGHCALVQGDRSRALEHWLSAVELTNRIRAVLPTERLRGGFFASRRQLYEETLKLALEIGATEQALAVAEAGKAQTFISRIASRLSLVSVELDTRIADGRWQMADGSRSAISDQRSAISDQRSAIHDPYLVGLLGQEERLRREMDSLRRELRLLQVDETGPVLRSEGELRSDQPQVLARLAELARAYEEVVERLRLVAPDWLDDDSSASFSMSVLRPMASAHLPAGWRCLSYYVLDDTLITFYLNAHQLKVYSRSLNAYDRFAVRQCTDPARDFRELIYRGTIGGRQAPNRPGRTYLQHLHQLLIPPEAVHRALRQAVVVSLSNHQDDACRDEEGFTEADLLIIAPHGPLHGLAFQALLDASGQPLAKSMPLAYVPSLSVLQSLLRRPTGIDANGGVLACGLSDFGLRANPLPHAADEVAVLRDVLGGRLHVLWGAEATRDSLLRLNETGDLAGYDVIHFATHAVLDHLAPSQSRVLLADDDLTLVDILSLRLGARMVVLSACEGAIGQRYPGDEIMGLARAFFMAGAQTVVASLWPVEDASASELMGRFYRRLGTGGGVVQALQAVQVEMADGGYVPYQWAPFITIGLP